MTYNCIYVLSKHDVNVMQLKVLKWFIYLSVIFCSNYLNLQSDGTTVNGHKLNLL